VTGLAAAGLLAALESVPGLSDALIGLGIGTVVGKLTVRRLERRHGELPAARIRHIETVWIGVWICVALTARGVVAALG